MVKSVSFVVSLNLHRRHLSESQRAMVGEKLTNMNVGKPSISNSANLPVSVSQPEAAKLLNVSERSIRTAKKVTEKAIPELTEKVSQGEVAVSTAAVVQEKACCESADKWILDPFPAK